MFPVCYTGGEEGESVMLGESTVETVCLLGKRKPDTTVRIGIDMEDYYRLIGDK